MDCAAVAADATGETEAAKASAAVTTRARETERGRCAGRRRVFMRWVGGGGDEAETGAKKNGRVERGEAAGQGG